MFNCRDAIDILYRCADALMNPNGRYFILKFVVTVHEIWRLRNSLVFNTSKGFDVDIIVNQIQGRCVNMEKSKSFWVVQENYLSVKRIEPNGLDTSQSPSYYIIY